MNIYQSNTNRKDLSWLYFDDQPIVQEVASEGPIALYTRSFSLSNILAKKETCQWRISEPRQLLTIFAKTPF